MKLSNKAADRVAVLINSLRVAEDFIARARANNDRASHYLWTIHKYDALISLDDELGIKLVGVTDARIDRPNSIRKLNELRNLRP